MKITNILNAYIEFVDIDRKLYENILNEVLKGRYTNKDTQDGRWNKVKKAFCVSFVCYLWVGCVPICALTWCNKIHTTKQNILHSYHVVFSSSTSWRIFFSCTYRQYKSLFIYPFLQHFFSMIREFQNLKQ